MADPAFQSGKKRGLAPFPEANFEKISVLACQSRAWASISAQRMRPHSRQILSVEEVFGKNGWHAELVDGRDVLRAGFEAHHTRVDLIAQAFPELNALSAMTINLILFPKKIITVFTASSIKLMKRVELNTTNFQNQILP